MSELDNSGDMKTIFLIDRESGLFQWLDHFYLLDFPSKTLFLIEGDIPTLLCTGRLEQNVWHFESNGAAGSHADPFAAAIQTLINIVGKQRK